MTPARKRILIACHLVAISMWAASACAQADEPAQANTTSPEEAREPENDPTIEQTIEQLEMGVGPAERLEPVDQYLIQTPDLGLPEMPTPSYKPEPGRLIREGAFLNERRGRMIQLRSGSWVFLFDADARGDAEPPMILLPCRRLDEMIRLSQAREETVTFRINGEAFVYRGRNYLLPTFFTTIASTTPQPGDDEPMPQRPERSPEDDDGNSDDEPSIEELIEQVESRSQQAHPVAPPMESESDTGDLDLLQDGSTLKRQRGRVLPGPTGGWLFTQDSDVDSPESGTHPLILLPCQNLMAIERIVHNAGEGLAFTLSGRVTTFQGRNYLLPTMYLVESDREGNLMPAQ